MREFERFIAKDAPKRETINAFLKKRTFPLVEDSAATAATASPSKRQWGSKSFDSGPALSGCQGMSAPGDSPVKTA